MVNYVKAAVAAGMLVCAATPSLALVLEGNYIRVGVSSYGTLGSNGNTSPGLIHDPSGTGTFNASTDYISPGDPHDGFSLIASQFGFTQNDNNGVSDFGFNAPTLLTGAAAMGYDNAAQWSGGNGFVNVLNRYFFNDGDERILVYTTITALSNITNLAFARSVDPDSGVTSSANQRGNTLFGVDDFVGSASTANGRTLALVNLNGNTYTHTTQINSSCCDNINPNDVLAHTGGDLGLTSTGDHGLNLAYRIGSLSSGSSVTLNYAYAVGTRIAVVGGDPTPSVPEPATWAMMVMGFGAIGSAIRRRNREARVTFA